MALDPAWMRVIYPLLYGAALLGSWKLVSLYRPTAAGWSVAWLEAIAGWGWFLFAAGGGLGLLLLRGPWPPTNGWFALMSGLAACPLLARLVRKAGGLKISGSLQFVAAVLLVSIGRAALMIWPQAHPL